MANATHDGTEVENDFDSLYPWSEIKTYNYNTTTNQITAYIGEPGFKFDGTNGEVMTRFPEFWYKREQKEENGNTYEYIYIADYAEEGFTKSEQFSLSRYTASGNSSKIGSANGKTPLNNTTAINFRTYAKALGSNWGLLDIWHWSILQLLYLVEYADYNSQNKLGQGVVGKQWNDAFNGVESGGCDLLGMKSGCFVNDGLHSVIYRGIEDIFGNAWQICDGINLLGCQSYVCHNPASYEFDVFNEEYVELGYENSNAYEQYTKKIGYDANNPLIQFPVEGGGSNSTYITDYYWCSTESDANRVVWVGGVWDADFRSGLWSLLCNSSPSMLKIDRVCRLLLNQ